MKKHMKRIIIIIVLVVVVLSYSTTALAWARLGSGQISGGATGILYYIDSEAYEYRHSIGYGIEYWNGHTSDVSVSKTTTQSYSRCDNYWGQYFGQNEYGVIAATQLILNNQVHTDYDVDWYWSKIYFNSNVYKYESQGGLTYFDRKGTSCHEYGHFLGLWHSINTSAVMCQLGAGRTAGSPSTDDLNGINAIY